MMWHKGLWCHFEEQFNLNYTGVRNSLHSHSVSIVNIIYIYWQTDHNTWVHSLDVFSPLKQEWTKRLYCKHGLTHLKEGTN